MPLNPGMLTSSKNHGEFALEHLLERLLARCRGEQVLLEFLEDGLIDE